MTPWTSPPYKFDAKTLSGARWLLFRVGSPFTRFYTTLLFFTHYLSLTVGAACVVILMMTSGISLPVVGWLYFGGIIGISTLRLRLRQRRRPAVVPAYTQVVRTATIDEWGITQTFDSDQARMTWPSVAQILKSRHGIFLSLDSVRYYVIPAECFTSPDEMDSVYKQAVTFHEAARDVDRGYPSAWPNLCPDRPPDVVYELSRSSVWSNMKRSAIAHSVSILVWLFVASMVAYACGTDTSHNPVVRIAYIALAAYTVSVAMSNGRMIWYRSMLTAWACGPRFDIWLEPAGMIVRSPTEQSSSPWSFVSRIDRVGDFISFHQDTGVVRAIPLAAWSRTADADAFYTTALNYQQNDALDRAGGTASSDVWPPPPNRKPSA
jgi:hypothetical protein